MRDIALICMAVACTQPAPTPTGDLPWLQGFTAIATTQSGTPQVSDKVRPWRVCEEPCVDDGAGFEVTADVVPTAGVETILASYSSGVVVLDARGRLIARGSAFDLGGSADELVGLAVGDAWLDKPVIAVAARIGGHRESVVWLELYRVGRTARLERLFAAIVEEHDGEREALGSVTLSRGQLMYRAPGGVAPERWIYDGRAGRYLPGALSPDRKPPPTKERDFMVRARPGA